MNPTQLADRQLKTPPGAITVNSIELTVNFGAGESFASSSITGVSWVNSNLNFLVRLLDSVDHTVEESMVEGVTASVGEITNGVGFILYAYAPNETSGIYKFIITAF